MNPIVNRAGERGAILVQAAIIMLVLTALTTFVVDYAVLGMARTQAQNAADAGALSGAIARAYDETTAPPAAGGAAELSAMRTAFCAAGSPNCPPAPATPNPDW